MSSLSLQLSAHLNWRSTSSSFPIVSAMQIHFSYLIKGKMDYLYHYGLLQSTNQSYVCYKWIFLFYMFHFTYANEWIVDFSLLYCLYQIHKPIRKKRKVDYSFLIFLIQSTFSQNTAHIWIQYSNSNLKSWTVLRFQRGAQPYLISRFFARDPTPVCKRKAG